MSSHRFLLALGITATVVMPLPAGIIFGRHPKPSPAERVSQLLATVKTSPDDSKRASAAKELRAFDLRSFPEIAPALIEVLKHDQQSAVRAEAAQTLGKLRPISTEVGMALEEAVGDPSWRVRWQARESLVGYRIGGYRTPPKPDESAKQVINQAPPAPPAKRSLWPHLPSKTGPTLMPNETPPPPLADPPVPATSGPVLQSSSMLVPAELPKLQTPPSGR